MDILEQMKQRLAKARALGKAYRRIFSSSEGRLVLEDLMSVSGVTRGVRSNNQEMSYQNEAVRLFVFGILKKAGLRQQQIVDSVYEKIMEHADGPSGTKSPPAGSEIADVRHAFSIPAPDDI